MNLQLSDEQAAALERELTAIIDGDRYFLSRRAFSPDSPVSQAPVMIGNNVWIGARAMILAGSRIGDHAVIAANSVVNGDVPARSVAAGAPARVVRTFEAPDNWVRN